MLTFAQLIAHLCKTRNARAGTIAGGEPVTGFMPFGDMIRIEMLDKAGKSVFGAIEQTVKWRDSLSPGFKT